MIQKGDYYILENDVEAIRLLTEKSNELKRLPKKQDFEVGLVGAIKARLGPWPRALEKAGLKKVGRTYSAENATAGKEKAIQIDMTLLRESV